MYLLALKRKKEQFKKNNVALCKFLALIFVFIVPLLLLFAPLPGFLLLQKDQTLEGVALGAFIIFILAIWESFNYWFYWKKEEIEYLNYIATSRNVIKDNFIALLRASILFHIVVISTFYRKPELSIYSITSFILLTYPVLFLVFYGIYKIKLSRMRSILKFPIYWKVMSLLFKGGVIIKLIFICLFTFCNYVFIHETINEETKFTFFLIFSGVCLFLSYITSKALFINIEEYKLFLNSINSSLVTKLKRITLIPFITLTSFNMFIGFFGIVA